MIRVKRETKQLFASICVSPLFLKTNAKTIWYNQYIFGDV